MKYIKLYDNFNSEGDEDVEYILTDYYHSNKVDITNNKYYKLYRFSNIDNYNDACKELDKHDLEYRKAIIGNTSWYIITNLSQEVIDFLDNKLLSLKTKESDKYVYYLNNIDDGYAKTYYYKSEGVFWINYNQIWTVFKSKFSSNGYSTQAITTWYVVTNLQKECSQTISHPWKHRQKL